jgi:hypothetical protein
MEKNIDTTQEVRKTYVKPEILHELDLETRADISLTPPNFLDENQ